MKIDIKYYYTDHLLDTDNIYVHYYVYYNIHSYTVFFFICYSNIPHVPVIKSSVKVDL